MQTTRVSVGAVSEASETDESEHRLTVEWFEHPLDGAAAVCWVQASRLIMLIDPVALQEPAARHLPAWANQQIAAGWQVAVLRWCDW